MSDVRVRRAWIAFLLLGTSSCFLVSGLEDEASTAATTSSSATSSMPATTGASVSSGQGGANGSSSSSGSTGSGEGGSGGMAPIAYARTFEGLRFESFVSHQGRIFVGGTKEPETLELDGHPLSNQRQMIVAAFSAETGMAEWVKEIHPYDDPADPRSISIAMGDGRLVVGTTTRLGMWIETADLAGAGGLAPVTSCTNPGGLPDFYRNVKVAALGAQVAIAFNTAPRATNVTISCTPDLNTSLETAGVGEEVFLFTHEGTFSGLLNIGGLNAGSDVRPSIAYTTLGVDKRIAISFERGSEVRLGLARRDVNGVTTFLQVPSVLGSIFPGLGGLALGGTDDFVLVSGGLQAFDGTTLTSGSGLLRTKMTSDGQASAPEKLDSDGVTPLVTAGALVGTAVSIQGNQAIVSGWSNDMHKLGVMFPPEGVTVGGDVQRSMFFVDFGAATFDRITHAISIPLGSKTLGQHHHAQADALGDGVVAAGVVPNDATLCAAQCGPYPSTGERGCAFLLRQPFLDLPVNGGDPRVPSGCYPAP